MGCSNPSCFSQDRIGDYDGHVVICWRAPKNGIHFAQQKKICTFLHSKESHVQLSRGKSWTKSTASDFNVFPCPLCAVPSITRQSENFMRETLLHLYEILNLIWNNAYLSVSFIFLYTKAICTSLFICAFTKNILLFTKAGCNKFRMAITWAPVFILKCVGRYICTTDFVCHLTNNIFSNCVILTILREGRRFDSLLWMKIYDKTGMGIKATSLYSTTSGFLWHIFIFLNSKCE